MLSLMLLTLIGCGEKEEDTAEETVVEENNQNGIYSWNNCFHFCFHLGLVSDSGKSNKKNLTRFKKRVILLL